MNLGLRQRNILPGISTHLDPSFSRHFRESNSPLRAPQVFECLSRLLYSTYLFAMFEWVYGPRGVFGQNMSQNQVPSPDSGRCSRVVTQIVAHQGTDHGKALSLQEFSDAERCQTPLRG